MRQTRSSVTCPSAADGSVSSAARRCELGITGAYSASSADELTAEAFVEASVTTVISLPISHAA